MAIYRRKIPPKSEMSDLEVCRLVNRALSQGMQPWESVQGWFDKIDLLISEIKEVSRIAETAIPAQCSDAAICRMLSKHLTPV